MRANNFDIIAPVYDLLTKLIFLGRIQQSHLHWIFKIPDRSNILIVGGGSGRILNALKGKDCNITYVEMSSKMINGAKKRSTGLKIQFIQDDFNKCELDTQYDVIITFFFLDVFYDQHFFKVIDKIKSLINDQGIWLIADFENNGEVAWKGTLLKLMFLFFKITTNLEAVKLLPIRKMVTKRGFKELEVKYFFRKFIFSSVFVKN